MIRGSPLAAFGLLTIVPVPAASSRGRGLDHAVASFPLVGLALGAATAALDWALRLVLPVPVATVLDLAFLAVASGGLHLDGLADAADGLFAGGGRERRLAAMRDSRAGAFGVTAVVLVILLEFAALSTVAAADRAMVLIAAATLSRWAMSLAVWSFPPARGEGLGATVARQATVRDLALATAVMGLVVGTVATAMAAMIALALTALVVLAVGGFARARVGGTTGDVCGAIGELSFACELAVLAAVAG